MKQAEVKFLIANFVGQANQIPIPVEFVFWLGGYEVSALMVQCLYWSERTNDPERWFYKSYPNWHEELGLSEYQIRRAAKHLIEKELIETKLKKVGGAPVLHYRVNDDRFSESILKFLQNPNRRKLRIHSKENEESFTIQNPLSEPTTENNNNGGTRRVDARAENFANTDLESELTETLDWVRERKKCFVLPYEKDWIPMFVELEKAGIDFLEFKAMYVWLETSPKVNVVTPRLILNQVEAWRNRDEIAQKEAFRSLETAPQKYDKRSKAERTQDAVAEAIRLEEEKNGAK